MDPIYPRQYRLLEEQRIHLVTDRLIEAYKEMTGEKMITSMEEKLFELIQFKG